MSLVDRIRERAVEALGDATGLMITDREEYSSLVESGEQFRQYRDEVDELASWTMSYFSGRPADLRPEKQRELAQKARIAWGRDPIAGTEAEHYANFAIGRGVNRPRARRKEVQAVINRAWTDSNNADKLLNPDALHALSNELRAGANVYVLAFTGGGRVRISFLEADSVEAIVTDEPEDRHRPLYYCAHRVEATWDFERHQRVVNPSSQKIVYHAHWRNVEEAAKEKKAGLRQSTPIVPPKGALGDGVVYHVRVNRLLEQQMGMPFWNRTLRYFSALNRLLEARVSMAQASASIIAKTVMRGSERDIIKSAESLQRRTGEFGAARGIVPGGVPAGLRPPIGPAGFQQENEQSRLEAVSLNSGASNAVQDINVIRGAATAPSALGPHYFGDTSGGMMSAACHDELTETLTSEGWMTYEQLRGRDAAGTLPRIAGFDPETLQVQYHQPLQKMLQYDYDGEMVAYRNGQNDILVTPDHRMFVRKSPGSRWEFVEARDTSSGAHERTRWQTPKAGMPVSGRRTELFMLPSRLDRVTNSRFVDPHTAQRVRIVAGGKKPRPASVSYGLCGCGCGEKTPVADRNRWVRGHLTVRKGEPQVILPGHNPQPLNFREIAVLADASELEVKKTLFAPRRYERVMRPEIPLKMDAFLYWLGWYIAEGSGGGEVAQAEFSPWLPSIQKACRELGHPGIEKWKGDGSKPGGRMWHWIPRNPAQWQDWLHGNCGRGASNKKVPAFVFGLPPEQQMLILRGLMEGDGSCGVDDTWERRGGSVFGTISPQLNDDVHRLAINCGFRTRRVPGGVSLVGTQELSTVQRHDAKVSRLPKGETVSYVGRVYCFTLPTQTMITRRNGYVAFAGNTLELPALLAVGAHQETIERLLRWFTDLAIQEAVRSGELGAGLTDEEDSAAFTLSEFEICESDQVMEAEKRLKMDLSYSFEMPYPGRRNLGEVVSAFTSVLTQLSPIGENSELTETMLNFLFTHGMQMEDAAELAERVNSIQQGLLKRQAEGQAAAAAGTEGSATAEVPSGSDTQPAQPADGTPVDSGNAGAGGPQTGSTRKRSDDTKRSQYGEPRQVAAQEETGAYGDVDGELRELLEGVVAEFESAARVNG